MYFVCNNSFQIRRTEVTVKFCAEELRPHSRHYYQVCERPVILRLCLIYLHTIHFCHFGANEQMLMSLVDARPAQTMNDS